MDKIEVLVRLLQAEGRGLTIVFCRTKRNADQVAGTLTTRGFATAAVHGDLGQGQRERAMRAFRSGKVDVLVATDVAARGLDVDDITHVVNYECPEDENAYLHRIGRTGRAGRTGVAVTFVDWADLQRWKLINEALSLGKPEPAETYSTSEHLFTALNIPAGATGILPRAQRERAGLEAERLEDIGETGKVRSQAGRGGRPGDGRPGDGRSSDGRSSDGRSSDGRSSDGLRGDGRAGEGRRGGGRNPAAGESAPVREAGRRGQRTRHRTRSGVPLEAGQAGPEQASDSNHSGPGNHGGPGQDGVTAPSAGQPATAARRPRRRRSRGAGSAGAGAAGGAGTETAPAAVSASTAAAVEL
jgi:superfamily II DNA/RNA helicase